MTPFMMRVLDLLDADPDQVDIEVAPLPLTRISHKIATSTGADRHVAIRALAEQLLCEANAVLPVGDGHLTLADDILPDELAFTLGYRGRGARVSTTFRDGTAFGRLVGDGFESEIPHELEGPDALPDLLIRLLVESGVGHHRVH